MILERALFWVKSGYSEEFKSGFAKARRFVEQAKGCRRVEMRQAIESKDNFLLLVWWERLEDHTEGFRQSDAFNQWRALLSPYFASPPMVEHYQEPL